MSTSRVLIERGATNLVTNPTFAVNTTGWLSSGGASLARTTSWSYYGPASGLLTATGVGATATVTGLTIPATSHTMSFIVRNNASSTRTVRLRYAFAYIGDEQQVGPGEVARIVATFTGNGLANQDPAIRILDSANGETMNIGHAQIESGPAASNPIPAIDESGTIIPPDTWSGTAHQSASNRPDRYAPGFLAPDTPLLPLSPT